MAMQKAYLLEHLHKRTQMEIKKKYSEEEIKNMLFDYCGNVLYIEQQKKKKYDK